MEDFLIDLPAQISTKDPLFGLDMHPKRNLVAYSSASGAITVQEYTPKGPNKPVMSLSHHVKSCRSVVFSGGEGKDLFSCSSDKSIVGIDIETRRTVFDQKKAHKSPINTMLLHENLVFSGDEDGVIKIWDQRQPEKVKEISENEDFISAFAVNADRGTLLATSGDQTLTVVDFGGRKLLDRSEQQDDELMSISLIKGGKKAVCGDSIDCIVPVDENTIITGCGDGIIRIVSILPNKILGVISAQGEELGISALSISHDKKYLTACVDTSIQFWNVSMLFNDDGEKEEGVEEEDQVVEEDNGESGIDEDEEGELSFDMTPTSESDSDDDSDSDSDSNNGKNKKFASIQPIQKNKHYDSAKAAFFEDL